MKVQLRTIAHARSGDKGDTSNIGLIALKPEYYAILAKEVTAERVKQHFVGICHGEVEGHGPFAIFPVIPVLRGPSCKAHADRTPTGLARSNRGRRAA